MARAIIIGSGIGGLASGVRLARMGIKTTIYEASESAGGKISELKSNGFRFDTGPSLLTLPELILELLDNDLQFKVQKLKIITKYFYEDGTQFNAYSDVENFAEQINKKFNISNKRIAKYLRHASNIFDLTANTFIFGSFHRIKNLMNLKVLKILANFRKLHVFKSLHQFNEQELEDKKLVQMFDRYATYNGSNPYQTPATLCVISHLEHNTGAYVTESGMHKLTETLIQQAERLGVEFRFNQPVRKIEVANGKIRGVRLDSGFVPADIVVSDIDIHQIYSSLLPDSSRLAKINKGERSSSALIFYWGMKGIFSELDVHNIFFSANYKEEFDHLFRLKDVFNDPTVYIYISSKYRKEDAPAGCENWFVMINVPADIGQNWEEIIPQSRQNILDKLDRLLGKKLSENIENEVILSPPEIWKQTGSVNGSLYGSSSNNRYASFNRHANFHSKISGLYFVGGSVHPGGGIPLCLSSAGIVEQLVKEQLLKSKK